MTQSTSIIELAKALNAFQTEAPVIPKDGVNPYYRSNFATLEGIWTTIRPTLVKHGLSISQLPTGENELTTILLHVSGEFISATIKMTPKDSTPQSQGSAITYMRRYAMSAILGLVTEEDDDGNATKTKQVNSPLDDFIPPEEAQYYESLKPETEQKIEPKSESKGIPCPNCGVPYNGKFPVCYACNLKKKK